MRLSFTSQRKPRAYLIGQSVHNSQANVASQQELGVSCETVHFLPANQISRRAIRRARARIGMVGLCFGAVYLGLGMRLAEFSFADGMVVERVNHVRGGVKEGARPEIMDRNGVLLATNLPAIALEVSGREVWDAKETAISLSEIFEDIDPVRLERKLKQGRHVEVRSDLTPQEHQQVFALGIPGAHFSRQDHRFYPQEGLAPHLIGHVVKGRARSGAGGMMGLEKLLDNKEEQNPIYASIDVRAQQALEKVLSDGLNQFSAEAAWGGIMDVHTGELIAAASLPEFNLNDPSARPTDARRNRFVYDRYDLGSAFKAITAASIIESGLADEATPYDARGVYEVSGVKIKDYKGKNKILTLSEVVQHSSNIGSARMAHQMGPELQQHFLQKLGLFNALPIELSENRSPDLPKKWGPVEAATVSYGHGIAVTPLHLLAAYGALVNGGIYHLPTFVKNAEGDSPKGERVFSPSTSAKIRRILRRTVINGSAKRAEVDGYFSIGKTSTADKPGRGGYLKNARISSFAGAFPGYDPRYVVLVSLDNPQPTKETYGYATAGWTAAPMFQKLVTRVGPILGVPMVSDQIAMDAFFADAYNYDSEKEVIRKRQDVIASRTVYQRRNSKKIAQQTSRKPQIDPIKSLIEKSAAGAFAKIEKE